MINNDEFLRATEEHNKALSKLPKEEQKRLARELLIKEGIYKINKNGDFVLHENYGGEKDD